MPEMIAFTLTVGAILLVMYVLIALGVRAAAWVVTRWNDATPIGGDDDDYARWRGE